MPNEAGLPLKKITINVYDEDLRYFRYIYGDWGWGIEIRNILHKWVQAHVRSRRSYGYDSEGTLGEQGGTDSDIP
jgi:hypothetical protein